MLPLRFVSLLVILFAVQAWCKPAKSSESVDYIEDDPPSDYNDDDTIDDEDDTGALEEPPQIISKPQSIHVRNGSTIYLHCLLKNAEKFAVTWKKDDEFLYYDSNPMNADKERMVRLWNNTLVIYNATLNDTSNDYECSILNKPPITIKHRVLVSDEAPVPSPLPPRQQHKPPPVHVTPAKRVEVNVGQNITLGCESREEPMSEIKWYHENKRINNNIIVTDNRITIVNINKHDSGRYQCLIENGKQNPPVGAISVVVNYAPEIETKGKWVHTGLGVESQLMCNVHAYPHAKVTWMKDEKEVMPKRGSIEIKGNKTRHILEILHTEREHLGNYTCIAQNILGRAEKTISLTGLPSQAMIFDGEMTKTDSGLILKWQLESYSPITEYKLQYRSKGDDNWIILKPTVTNGKGNQFTVEYKFEGLEPGSYEAILMARNDFGWSPPSKPHMFVGVYADEQVENVKGSSSSAYRFALDITILFLVVSSYALSL
ncbi:opioid-binding protein/cell adhesion molecule homolog [Bombus terrestris]|uniref:Opioid-binding protein/cell adhesion molecule homolog n=1 Tax=Bombus terrestris TaxID=30195 RepID=A0A9B0BHH7_BOMTE|nr:opioid-binding protein/cell adhesion molecule homolog [Bombus terrestris]